MLTLLSEERKNSLISVNKKFLKSFHHTANSFCTMIFYYKEEGGRGFRIYLVSSEHLKYHFNILLKNIIDIQKNYVFQYFSFDLKYRLRDINYSDRPFYQTQN